MDHIKLLEVEIYRTPEGKPTCASDYRTGKVCEFLRTRKFGTVNVCFFGDRDMLDEGYQAPHDGCPIWK
jgi:hypothetical protein